MILFPTAISPPVTLTPVLAVTIPTESTLVTSSYVNTPPTLTFPVTVRAPPTVALVLIATLLAFKFKLSGLSILGDEPKKFISFTPKPFSAIILFDYLYCVCES